MNQSEYTKINLPDIGEIYCTTDGKRDAKFLYNEIFRNRDYLQKGIELEENDTVFDVGANLGLFTLFVNNECNGKATIYSFEPIPKTFDLLKMNVDSLAKKADIKLFDIGLNAIGGLREIEFAYYKYTPGNSTCMPGEKEHLFSRIMDPANFMVFVKDSNKLLYYILLLLFPLRGFIIEKLVGKFFASEKVLCKTTSLSDIIMQYKVSCIDLLKIDVEGGELDVLRGLKDEHWGMIKQVTMEVHDIDGKLAKIDNMLREKGFKLVKSDQSSAMEKSLGHNYNLYAKKRL